MARTARVALVQLPAFGVEDAAASLEHTLRRIDDAARQRPDIIALPEVTYPAYFLGSRDLSSLAGPSPAEAAAAIAAKAREHGVYVAAGLALEAPGGGYTNGAALFARDGGLAGHYDKSFLWHFDARWFSPGGAHPVFETDVARIGMLVCADGRLPEIARSLALNGAQIILDLTAWVSGARRPQDLTTVQREYLMQVRAAENGLWVAAADKVGVEAESIVYCGRSCVIDPRGAYAASLGPDEEGVLVYDVPVQDTAPPVARRPELYEALAQPTESLPVVRTLDEPLVPRDEERRIAAVQMRVPDDARAYIEALRRHVRRLALQDADVVLFPSVPLRLLDAYDHHAVLAGIDALARDTGVCVAFALPEQAGGGAYETTYLCGPRGVIASHRRTHGEELGAVLGDRTCPVVHTPVGRVGLMAGAEGFVPEVARSLMLRGAEILLWSAGAPALDVTPFARARADENRVFVACATAPVAEGGALIADPAGRLLAQALERREMAVSATVNRALSHLKEMAPGTDVVRNRQPETYAAITRTGSVAGRVV